MVEFGSGSTGDEMVMWVLEQHRGKEKAKWWCHAATDTDTSTGRHSSNYLAVVCQWNPPGRVLCTLTLPLPWGLHQVQPLQGNGGESKNEDDMQKQIRRNVVTIKHACQHVSVCSCVCVCACVTQLLSVSFTVSSLLLKNLGWDHSPKRHL